MRHTLNSWSHSSFFSLVPYHYYLSSLVWKFSLVIQWNWNITILLGQSRRLLVILRVDNYKWYWYYFHIKRIHHRWCVLHHGNKQTRFEFSSLCQCWARSYFGTFFVLFKFSTVHHTGNLDCELSPQIPLCGKIPCWDQIHLHVFV